VEYVEKQPTLEDVFFAIVGNDGAGNDGAGSDDGGPSSDGTEPAATTAQ
jgi:ABC-2 type transport system ATP-binding protein